MQLTARGICVDRLVMDIASLASAFSGLIAARTAASIQIAVAAKVADSQRDVGAAVVHLLQAAGEGVESAAADVANAASLDILA